MKLTIGSSVTDTDPSNFPKNDLISFASTDYPVIYEIFNAFNTSFYSTF